MSEEELDQLAAMVAEADSSEPDADLEPEALECDGDEAIEGNVPDFVRRFLAGSGQHEDDENSGPAERYAEEGPFDHEDDEESGLGRDCVPL